MASSHVHSNPRQIGIEIGIAFLSYTAMTTSTAKRKPLTHARQAETAKPEAKPYALNAGDGLFLEVATDGSKYWRFRYTFAGKRGLLSMGVFPAVGLQEAKEARDATRKLLAQGINPSEKRKDDKAASKLAAANSFEAIANEWMGRRTSASESTRRQDKRLLQYAIAEIGRRPISEITPPMVLAVCRKAECRGALETASRIKGRCSQVFRYAVATGRAERDPTTDLKGALMAPEVESHAAIIDPKQLAPLLRDIDNYSGRLTTANALRLSPLVFLRPGELRAAKWEEIDLDAATWEIPAARMKMSQPHIVPLSTQAISILRELHEFTVYVFKSTGKDGYLSENAVNTALRRMGYAKEKMSAHGFRATARTILDEVMKQRPDLIEHQLAHAVRDANGRAYNRTSHLPERTRMMQEWANYLDDLKAESNVVPFRKPA